MKYHIVFSFFTLPFSYIKVRHHTSVQYPDLSPLVFLRTNIGIPLDFLNYSLLQWYCYNSQQWNVLFLTEERASLESYFPGDSSMSSPFPSWLLVKNLASLAQIFWVYILYWLALVFVSFWNLILLSVGFYCKLPQFSLEMGVILKE